MELKIVRDKEVIAKMKLVRSFDDMEIAHVWVKPEFRGKGLASELMKKAQKRFNSLVAFVDPDGTGLTHEQIEAWNKRHGFKKCKYDFPDKTEDRSYWRLFARQPKLQKAWLWEAPEIV